MAVARRTLLIAGAATLGALVFSAAVVLTVRPDILNIAADAPQCRLASQMQENVAPVATGDMVGFKIGPPKDVSALPFDGTGDAVQSIEALKGKVILLNLWATWCAPCRAEMPSLAALRTAEADDDFDVIATSIDNRDANRPENFLQETGADALDYHREPTLVLFNSLKSAGLAAGMPTTLLLAPDGCVVGTLSGAAEWDGPDARRLIQAAKMKTN